LEDALNHVEEKHHMIIFLYKSDRQRFGKYIVEKENNKRILFQRPLKTCAEY